MTNGTATRIIVRTYEGDEGDVETDSFAIVTAADVAEIDLIIHPFTLQARTITLEVEQAWRLARELARTASAVEQRSEDE